MFGKLLSFFGGDSKGITGVATEWVKKAENQSLAITQLLKAIDPNGGMRRSISTKIVNAYLIYLLIMLGLIMAQSFSYGDAEAIKFAVTKLEELFAPITTLVGIIVGASFGVNGMNSFKGV